jgi:diguanylate cyclase (GGDEF)-like protein/PAS domain S-box-containing protein
MRAILDTLDEGVYFVDRERRITFWNRGAARITGHARGDITGRVCADRLFGMDDRGCILCRSACPLLATMDDGVPREAQVYLIHAEGHRVPVMLRVMPVRDEQGEVVGAVEVFTDSPAVVGYLRRISELSQEVDQDALTGIGNRRFIEREIDGRMGECHRHRSCAGLMLLDVDHFKGVNDRYGHAIGDRVLRMVANTLRHNIRSSDAVGRWGGEEFAVVIGQVLDQGVLEQLAEKLRMLVERSMLATERGYISVTVSIGATLMQAGDTPQSLLRRADELLYRSKDLGRNRVSLAA